MKLEYNENPNYIFISWNEESGGEYNLSPIGYVTEKGMVEYRVTSNRVEFILSKNGKQLETLVFEKPFVQWDVSKQNSSLSNVENVDITEFIEMDEIQNDYDAAISMPYAAPAPPGPSPKPGPSPGPSPKPDPPSPKTVLVTWTVDHVKKLVINGVEIEGEALRKQSIRIKISPSADSVTLKAYAACGYYICEQRRI